jgi:simple sugar transport system permease protein
MGLLFGILKSAQPLMQAWQIPSEIISIIMALAVVFLFLRPVMCAFVERLTKNQHKKEVS